MSKNTISECINKEHAALDSQVAQDETLQAMNDAISGKTYGPFNSVDALIQDLYKNDEKK